MLCSLRNITCLAFIVYCALTCYTFYILLKSNNNSDKESQYIHHRWSLPNPDDGEDWNPWGEEFERERNLKSLFIHKDSINWWKNTTSVFKNRLHYKSNEDGIIQSHVLQNVEIWGKAAIGLYLWEHLLGGKLEIKVDGIWSYGFQRIGNLKLKFRTGPGVIISQVPIDVEYLVLILNGRSEDKISFAKSWLDTLPLLQKLQFVILIILGNEQCHNEWLIPYSAKVGGLVNTTFIVYDSPLVDNIHFYQWPLGVATYRGFPKVDPTTLDLENARPYVCNFLGSIYPHSSREKLMNVIKNNNLTSHCFLKPRNEWKPKETKTSLGIYIESLRLSDLTLNPAGMNTECYRIYEAMAFGSVPVVENVMTPGACGNSNAISAHSPLRLLKTFNAPVIYVTDWSELPNLISKELLMPLKEKVTRRIKIVQWYENFKLHFRDQLISVLNEHINHKSLF